MDYTIPLTECIRGNAYSISSRNLIVGVFNGNTGFVGIREKFGNEYLFTEFHHDAGPPLGTVRPFKDLGPCPIEDLAEGHSSNGYFITNKPLFEWLKAKEQEAAVPCKGCGEPYWPVPWNDNGFCLRRVCWDARCQPCPNCGIKVLGSDGTQLCERCTDPLAYDLTIIEATQRLNARHKTGD